MQFYGGKLWKAIVKNEYAYLLEEFGFTKFEEYSEEENKKYAEMMKNGESLPRNVIPGRDESGFYNDSFYYASEDILTDNEKNLYLQMKKLKLLKTIKNCAVFFVVIEVIAIVGGIIGILSFLS